MVLSKTGVQLSILYFVCQTSNDYETAKLWLLEDEYEPFEGRLLAEELV
jgi:hypothetical protein